MSENWPPLETAQSSLIGLIAFTAAIAPLGVPAVLMALVLITIASDLSNRRRPSHAITYVAGNKALIAALAFTLFALVSSAWAARPDYSTTSVAQAAAVLFGSWYVAASLQNWLPRLNDVRQVRFARALPLSFVMIAVYFLLSWMTKDGITLIFAHYFPSMFDGAERDLRISKLGVPVGIVDFYFNRAAAALVLALVGLAAALRYWPRRFNSILLGPAAAALVLAICGRSGSATALLMLAAGLVSLFVALINLTWARRMLQASFLVLVVAAVPLAMIPKALNLEIHPSLPYSFRERVVIWNDLAHVASQHVFTGIGVNSIKFWKPLDKPKLNERTQIDRSVRNYWHPHNGYLQIWLELGLVGALLFAISGTLLIGRTKLLAEGLQPYAIALTGVTLAAIGPGWGIWQPWLVAAIGFGWIALVIVDVEFKKAE